MMPTTMCLGPIVFSYVTNLQEYQTTAEAAYAKHDVVKSAPVYEAMGDEETIINFQGVVHPHVTGVDGALAAIEQARANQIPLPLMRGDHTPMGWVIILKFERTDSMLEETGRALDIRFNVTLAKLGQGAGGALGGIGGLVGGALGGVIGKVAGVAQAASVLRLFSSVI